MDNKALSVLKRLALDIIQNSKGGHPGTTLSSAPIIYTLFTKHMKVNPNNPNWINRDRFIMSAGHGAPLLYAMLYLSGYQIAIEELKNYRQIGSKATAYPDIRTLGIDVTTGVPAQGLATSVGIALAERIYASKYNKKSPKKFQKQPEALFDYNTYVLVSDGDMMEGLSYEAASFAGNLKLGKLIVLYDCNGSTMDGPTNMAFTESVTSRFSALGWHTQTVRNGESISEINRAIIKAKKNPLPSFIKVNTKIGSGSLLEGTNKVHVGELTNEDFAQLKKKLGMEGLAFYTDKESCEYIRNSVLNKGTQLFDSWERLYAEYKKELSNEVVQEIENIQYNNLYLDLNKIDIKINNEQKEPLRDSNSRIMNIISKGFYNMIGGSSDSVVSTRTYLDGMGDISYNNFLGKNIFFGLRENLMGAVLNGLALSGFRPFGSTHLTDSFNMMSSIRMSALMDLPVTYIFTHDSITTGYDGPTHQPIEHLASLRAMPNLNVYRPADIKEIIGAWNCIMKDKKPSVITFARTEVKTQVGTNSNLVSKGAYIVSDSDGDIDAVLIATGAEVQVANSIKERLRQEGINIRVISMPCMEKYLEQSEGYKTDLFPYGARVFVLEYGSSLGFEKFVISSDYLFNINEFGICANKDDILNYFKLDIDSIIEKIKNLI